MLGTGITSNGRHVIIPAGKHPRMRLVGAKYLYKGIEAKGSE